MRKLIDITGRRFGRLLVVRRVENSRHNQAQWECRCDCGQIHVAVGHALKGGRTRSCGCLQKELTISRNAAKKGPRARAHLPTYRTWAAIRSRCTNPKATGYDLYGGRGIRVCPRWLDSYDAFVADMGERPSGKSIERTDWNGHYTPENCRWATPIEQANNKRNNRLVTYGGETLTIAQWGRRTGISRKIIQDRLSRGWPVDLALLSPANKNIRRIP